VATCHTLVPIREWRSIQNENEIETENKQAIQDHLYLCGLRCCLRYGVTLFTDGTGVGCHESEDNEKCSVCREDLQHQPQEKQMATLPWHCMTIMGPDQPQTFVDAMGQSKDLQVTQEIGKLEMAEWMKKALQSVQNQCCICLIHGLQEMGRHTLINCPSLMECLGISWREYVDWR